MSSTARSRPPLLRRPAPVAGALLLLAIGLAGCSGPDGYDEAAFSAALAAPGEMVTPETMTGETDFRIKLLEPDDPSAAQRGARPLELLLYDAATETPVLDARLGLTSRMPEHGTEDERDPEPVGDGIYRGATNHFMDGEWAVHLVGARDGGDTFEARIPFVVNGT